MFDFEIPLFAIRRGHIPGVGSAISNLIAGLAALGKSVNLPYTSKERLNQEFLQWFRDIQGGLIAFERYPMVPGGMSSRFLEETLYAQVQHRSARIIFPNYHLPPHSVKRDFEVAVIIHDCQHRALPGFTSKTKRGWLEFSFRRSLSRADHIFLISEFERGQIAKYYGEKHASRCHVIYNSINWSRYERGSVSDRIHEMSSAPYLLCVAHPYPHKNILKILRAYLKFQIRCPDFDLILVGEPSNEVRAFLNDLNPDVLKRKIKFSGYLTDADLGYLYKNASLFVSASSYEGFGMPAVEAMGFGAPVLVTDGTAFPEVTLGSARYCPDVPSPEVWSEFMINCVEHRRSEGEYQRIAEMVRHRYAPATVAGNLLDVLRQDNRC